MALSVKFPITTPPDMAGAFSSAVLVPVLLLPDENYPTNGYAVQPSLFGFRNRLLAFVKSGEPYTSAETAFVPVYDVVMSTLRLFSTITGTWTEVPAGMDLSMTKVSCAAFGF